MTGSGKTIRLDGVARSIRRARRPDRNHIDRLKHHIPMWFVALVLFAFSYVQIVLNPFGFSDLTQRYTQDVSNLLITGPHLYPTTGRDRISVALIEEDTLQRLQMPWPWNYSAHARVLDSILIYKPKAVVVDFLFMDSRPDETLGTLVETIARYHKANVPLYFEGGTYTLYGLAPLRKELAETGVPILDPTIHVYDGVVRQYPVTGRCYGRHGVKSETCPSLALRVYADNYPQHPLSRLKGKMELVWGTETDPHNLKWRNMKEGHLEPCKLEAGLILRIYRAFFDKSTAMSNCPYNAIVPIEGLLMGTEDKDFPSLLTNRVVFYGGALQGAQDNSVTPVGGLQPNVFVHAMALDNLISFNGKPEQNVMTVGDWTISNNPAQVMAIIPVILILSWMHKRRLRLRHAATIDRPDYGPVMDWFLDKGVEHVWHWSAFLLALGIGLLLALLVGLSVANWVGTVFVSAELAAMLLLGVPDWLWGYLRHVLDGRPDDLEEAPQ